MQEELEAALRRLNPTMPVDAIADALFKLKNFENAELLQKNSVFMDYIQHGIEVRYLVGGEERSGLVYLMDYKNPDNNSFIVANQWTFIENSNSNGVINLFSDVNGDFSMFDPKFLEEIGKMKEKNLAVELLKKLISEQVLIFKRTNLVKSQKFSEIIQQAMNRYLNGMLTNDQSNGFMK